MNIFKNASGLCKIVAIEKNLGVFARPAHPDETLLVLYTGAGHKYAQSPTNCQSLINKVML